MSEEGDTPPLSEALTPSPTEEPVVVPLPQVEHRPPVAPGVADHQRIALQLSRRNYTKKEIMHILSHMQAILPIGPDEWEEVRDWRSTTYSNRDVGSIHRKYSTLYRKKTHRGP